GTQSRERVRALGPDRTHQFFGAAGADEVYGAAIAERRIETEEPGQRGLAIVEPQQARPDELEQVDLLGVGRIETGAAQPARHLRSADAEHVRETGRRAEVDLQGLHFASGCDGHERRITRSQAWRTKLC